tara:strand:- start:4698 stop:5741 length:1044 start_codon:yes stop_codon:yes gene_type:complete
MNYIKILVTGVGGGVGQSIMKALRISKLPIKIIAADINPLNAGLYRSDKAIIVPRVENKNTLNWYIKNLNKHKVDILMVGSEYDLLFFSKNKEIIERNTNCNICVSDIETVKISEDKFLTQEFLKKNRIPYLKTFIPKNVRHAIAITKKLGLPVFLKSRFGTSSRNVHLIKNLSDIKSLFRFVSKPIVQEYAGYFSENDLNHEYTCSFFTTNNKKIIGPFVAKRKLLHGTSWIAEVGNFPKIKKVIKKIASLLKNTGSMNVQLRLGAKGPVPFEFNARFSGTTSIRAHFGFNEPEMYIKNYLLKKKIKQPKIKKGISLRYVEEIFLENKNHKNIGKKFYKGRINKWL